MSLSKKDFEGLAVIVANESAQSRGTATPAGIVLDRIADKIANFCAQQNPNFNRAKFLAACQAEPAP